MAAALLRALPRRAAALARPRLRCLSTEDPELAADLANLERIKAERNRSVTAPHIAVVPDGLAPAGPAHPEEAAALMRIPEIHKKRTVVISQKAQAATTSASHASKAWRLGWKTEERWTNPLMGWTSTADPLSNTELKFETAEQAARFATKMGWAFEVAAPIERNKQYGTNTYSHNFLQKWVETDLKVNGTETKHFARPGRTRRTTSARSSSTATASASSTATACPGPPRTPTTPGSARARPARPGPRSPRRRPARRGPSRPRPPRPRRPKRRRRRLWRRRSKLYI